jgi:hypothetical protein
VQPIFGPIYSRPLCNIIVSYLFSPANFHSIKRYLEEVHMASEDLLLALEDEESDD